MKLSIIVSFAWKESMNLAHTRFRKRPWPSSPALIASATRAWPATSCLSASWTAKSSPKRRSNSAFAAHRRPDMQSTIASAVLKRSASEPATARPAVSIASLPLPFAANSGVPRRATCSTRQSAGMSATLARGLSGWNKTDAAVLEASHFDPIRCRYCRLYRVSRRLGSVMRVRKMYGHWRNSMHLMRFLHRLRWLHVRRTLYADTNPVIDAAGEGYPSGEPRLVR